MVDGLAATAHVHVATDEDDTGAEIQLFRVENYRWIMNSLAWSHVHFIHSDSSVGKIATSVWLWLLLWIIFDVIPYGDDAVGTSNATASSATMNTTTMNNGTAAARRPVGGHTF